MSAPETIAEVAWTTRDTLYTVGISISFLFSIISTSIAIVSLNNTKKRDLNSFGDSESKIFESIMKAEEDFAQFNLTILQEKEDFESDKSNKDKIYQMSPAMTQTFNMRASMVLNVYEIACQRYLDEKLDKTRFGKTYTARLSKLCANPIYSPLIFNGGHDYSALKIVNDKLNNPEC